MNSFLRWAGSKKQQLPHLRALFPHNAKRYIEPFCGSACLFFTLEPSSAVLCDLNKELILTYAQIKKNVEQVIQLLRGYESSKEEYYIVRAQDQSDLPDVARAARFIYLNRNCFNGLYRTNLSGKFNVPYCPPNLKNIASETRLRDASLLLQRANLYSGDFQQVLKDVRKGDFVYLDPPYVKQNRRTFSEYLPNSFQEQDLVRLRDALIKIDRRGASFVLSYAETKGMKELFSEWNIQRVKARRNIAGFTSDRRGIYEILVTNS